MLLWINITKYVLYKQDIYLVNIKANHILYYLIKGGVREIKAELWYHTGHIASKNGIMIRTTYQWNAQL